MCVCVCVCVCVCARARARVFELCIVEHNAAINACVRLSSSVRKHLYACMCVYWHMCALLRGYE